MFQNYNNTNLAVAQLQVGIGASDTTIILKPGQGGLMPLSNFLLKLESLDLTSVFETKPVTKREIVWVDTRVGDTLVVVRGFDFCPAFDGATAQTKTQFEFSVDDYAVNTLTALQINDIQQEIDRLETEKANDDEVVKLDGPQVITGLKTVPTPILDGHIANKKFVEEEVLQAGVPSNLYVKGILSGVSGTQNDLLFDEQQAPFGETNITDMNNSVVGNVAVNQTLRNGVRIQPTKDCLLKRINLFPLLTYPHGASRAYLTDDTFTVLAQSPVLGNYAVFDYILKQGQIYGLLIDNGGAGYSRIQGPAVFPIVRTNINYISGVVNNTTIVNTINCISEVITAVPASYILVGNSIANSRRSIRQISSGIDSDRFRVILSKVGNPLQSLNGRLEQETAGVSNGTIIDPNATFSLNPVSIFTTDVEYEVVMTGSVNIPRGTPFHITFYQGTLGSEVVDGANYYRIGKNDKNTLTRYSGAFDGTSRTIDTINNQAYAVSDLFESVLLSKVQSNLSYTIKKYLKFTVGTYLDGENSVCGFRGIMDGFVGLSPGSYYYASNIPGVVTSVVGIFLIGKAVSPTQLLIIEDGFRKLVPDTLLGTYSGTGQTTLHARTDAVYCEEDTLVDCKFNLANTTGGSRILYLNISPDGYTRTNVMFENNQGAILITRSYLIPKGHYFLIDGYINSTSHGGTSTLLVYY